MFEKEKQEPEKKLEFSPSRFSLVYESKDRRFCLFSDADGHLTAVPASKLA